MSWFARIEESCAAFIEQAFARTFPTDLEPAQIARKLVTTMEAKTTTQDGRLTAPSRYTVRVSLDDYERLTEHRAYLEREWGELLADMAARVNVELTEKPAISLLGDPLVTAGAVEIDCQSRRFLLRMVKGVPQDGLYQIGAQARVGRNNENEILLVDPSVSRYHALVETEAGFPIVHDLDSTNGSFVNGERVKTRRLEVGDVLMFGKTKLRLEAV
ncbi:MAG: FHA domain-containing protein [Candidatus Eremiobacteraeota bacterium]|nr:FHA domain-containing protein [Candidatus Eremiobacteraeota bacterium]